MAQPNRQPKAMSSRLLTMKFMQRAAASPSSPSTPAEPLSKKQRLSSGSYNSASPSTPKSDAQAVEEALAAEEEKRTRALEREAAGRGESKWYLSIKEQPLEAHSPLQFVSAGYSMLDAASSVKERSPEEDGTEAARPTVAGRRSFGKFNRVVEKQQNPDLSSDSASEGSEFDEDEDEDDDPTGAGAMIAQSRREAGEKARTERRAKRKAEKADALSLADDRRQKHVNLNRLTSISGNTGGGAPSARDMTCHKCGKKGHIQRDCPKASVPSSTAPSNKRTRQLWLHTHSPPRGRPSRNRRAESMGSQQIKTSLDTAPHEEPAPTGTTLPDRTSKHSLELRQTESRTARKISRGKTPTGLGAEPLNIVILGASFGGLSCAHHFLDTTINHISKTVTSPGYRLVIVSPSTHLYWNIGAPRALVAPGLVKHEDAFIPIEPGFHRHRGHQFTIIQGECVSMDTSARTVTIELIGSTAQKRCSQINKRSSRAFTSGSLDANMNAKVQSIPYHALIMCTGSSAHSPLLSLHGPHLNTIGELNTHHAKIAHAKSIVVCGGGCSGVETAGQLATFLNYTRRFGVRRKARNPKQIILISGSDRCLPGLKPKLGERAEKILRKLGVEVKHNIRVLAVKEDFDLTGNCRLELSDDTSVIADMYIACTGMSPNSAYAPREMVDEGGYIRTNGRTMRVDVAGPRTYSIGDVASYSHNYVLDVYAAVPVVMHNLLNDLVAHELRLASPYGGNDADIEALEDKLYVQRPVDSQLCPIDRFGGVGMLMDKCIPAPMVHMLKGHDYKVSKAPMVVVNGGNPYATKTAMGNKYK
ncbi:hypothetical protein LTR08_007126 [Meristemomyces frigidus]|nr:hypothetical protein LTR08_007126 [Meristemomyces frigidus]